MAKEVQEVLHKFYMSYEDAKQDLNRFFAIVEVEGSVMPCEAIKYFDVSSFKVIEEADLNKGDIVVEYEAVFKLKTLVRETVLGTIIDKMYIYNNHYRINKVEEIK